jgi:hypothetical protein
MTFDKHPNVRAVVEEEDRGGEVLDTEQTIRDKIVHVMSIYPRISVSMLQIGVGTSLMPALWKPLLAKMIQDGQILEERKTYRTPSDRQQSYTILSLNPDYKATATTN